MDELDLPTHTERDDLGRALQGARDLFILHGIPRAYLQIIEALKVGDPRGDTYPGCLECGTDEERIRDGFCSRCTLDLWGWREDTLKLLGELD